MLFMASTLAFSRRLALFVLSLIASNGQAETNAWTAIGPSGGDVFRVVVDPLTPTTLYATTSLPGQIKSSDGGATWSWIHLGNGPGIQSLIAIGATLYAQSGAILKSEDDGATWTNISQGLGRDVVIQSLVAIGSTLYVGGFSGDFSKIFKTTDGGTTWTDVSQGLPSFSFEVSSLYAAGATLYAVSSDLRPDPIYRSEDGGNTWLESSTGLNNTGNTSNVKSLVSDGSALYVLTSNGILKSSDNGATWVDITASWANLGLNQGVLPLTLLVQNAVLYAGTTSDGLFRSQDGGSSWTSNRNLGLINRQVMAYTNSGSTWYASTIQDGIFISKDDGETWQASNDGFSARNVDSLWADGAALITNISNYTTHVYRSTDRGNNWTFADFGERINTFFSLDDTLYAGGYGSVSKSIDNGATWTSVAINPIDVNAIGNITSFAAVGTDLYAGTAQECVFKSTDAGGSWTPTCKTNPFPTASSLIAIDSVLFAVNQFGFLEKSVDGGVSWVQGGGGFGFLAVNGSALFAATSNGLYVSTDKGATWTERDAGMGSSPVSIGSFLVNNGTVYVGTGSGIFATRDNGVTWVPLDSAGLDLPNLIIALAVDSRNLYAGSAFSGLYAMALAPPVINDLTPPDGMVGKSYNFRYISAGTVPVTFSISKGSLPAGLTMSDDGVVSGTPTKPGLYTWSVTAANGVAPDNTRDFSISIDSGSGGGGGLDLLFLALCILKTCVKGMHSNRSLNGLLITMLP